MEKIGEALIKARVEKGITLEQIETETNIRRRYLEAMENEDWGKLPGDVYIKSFLRTYCRYLGLNEKEYLDCFKKEYIPEPKLEAPQITREIELPVSPRRKTGAIFGIIAIILLFGTSYVYRQYIFPSIEIKEPQVVEEDKPSDIPPDAKDTPVPTQPEAINLYLKCLGNEGWVQVKDSENKKIYEGTMVKDQELSFDNLQKVTFKLGNAGQMQVMINGKDLGILGKYVVNKTYIFENNEVKDVSPKTSEQSAEEQTPKQDNKRGEAQKPAQQKPVQQQPPQEDPVSQELPVQQKPAQQEEPISE